MRPSCVAVSVSLFALLVSPTFAQVPAAAMNKTITISFTSTGTAKSPEGETKGFSTSVSRMIYVSSAGRLFMRHTASNAKASRGGDFDPNDTRTGKGDFRFNGDKLVGVIPYAAGARQITVTSIRTFQAARRASLRVTPAESCAARARTVSCMSCPA